MPHPSIDARIKQTYIAESTAQKTKLYDMYARFFRWASDRLAADSVLAFVTNRSFIESRTFDGFRKTVAAEFSEAYIVDFGGDVRANPKPAPSTTSSAFRPAWRSASSSSVTARLARRRRTSRPAGCSMRGDRRWRRPRRSWRSSAV